MKEADAGSPGIRFLKVVVMKPAGPARRDA